MVRDKVRIRFRKSGALRLISHHDLMRCFERMLRRAAIPFHSTAGFNPKPRLIFALSLGLGVVGRDEIADLELDEEVSPEQIHERLSRQAPDGLDILSVCRIGPKVGGQVCRICYRLPLPAERHSETERRITEVMALTQCPVTRTKPEVRHIDIRPYLQNLRIVDHDLEMDFHVTPHGTARPDEVVGLLGLADLLDAGAVLERTKVELFDEGPSDPVGTGERAALQLKGDS